MTFLTFYTSRFLAQWQAGMAFGPIIFIRPEYKEDVGLYQHELKHVKQFFRYFPIMGLLYKFSRKWRAKFEAEAYAVQMQYPDRNGNKLSLENAVYRLMLPQYDLQLSVDQAVTLIEKENKQ